MTRPALMEGGLVVVAGLALYGAAAGIEIALGANHNVSALLEELEKSVLIMLFGWLGIRARAASWEHSPAKQARSLALGAARGLSLGLVAVTVFAGAENLGYLIAFPESGVLTRLLWSLPVHLVAALTEALGALCLFHWLGGTGKLKRRLAGLPIWIGTMVLAMAWHLAANLLVSNRLAF